MSFLKNISRLSLFNFQGPISTRSRGQLCYYNTIIFICQYLFSIFLNFFYFYFFDPFSAKIKPFLYTIYFVSSSLFTTYYILYVEFLFSLVIIYRYKTYLTVFFKKLSFRCDKIQHQPLMSQNSPMSACDIGE